MPPSLAKCTETQCYLGGGVVSEHTAEKYIRLVNAELTNLSWQLGSLNIFEGINIIIYNSTSNAIFRLLWSTFSKFTISVRT